MNRLNGRLARLENQTKKQRRGTWQIVYLKEPTDSEIEKTRAAAVAAGWQPEDGPYCIIIRHDR